MKKCLFATIAMLGATCVLLMCAAGFATSDGDHDRKLDQELAEVLQRAQFTGRVGERIEARLGRRINDNLANLGHLLWFDTLTGLNDDNSCGIENNGVVGPNRTGPRNQRRTPFAINTAFYPALMWNGRFAALSGNPFDNRQGFQFPSPEGLSLSYLPHLLTAQAFIPPTERNEVAGFHFPGDNFAIRDEVLRRLNATPNYRRLFGEVFPQVRRGGPITFDMFGQAIAEFEFTLIFADAPIDEFARGHRGAMTRDQKRGALLFFGKAGCVNCHAVSGNSNEMFSDFQNHVAGVPQICPTNTNSVFDGAGINEDFGLEQVTGNPDDRYKFRSSPLRNLALQPAFFHNGAFTSLERALRFHINTMEEARRFAPARLDTDLMGSTGPMEPVLARLDPLLAHPVDLNETEFRQLLAFLREGLLDERARPERLRRLIPRSLPSGRPVATFE